MSHERARNRAEREREAGVKAAAKGAQREREERRQAHRQRQRQVQRNGAPRATKPSHPRTQGGKRGHAPVGRPDGPLAHRRRVRTRFVLVLLVAANVVAWILWSDWYARLAVLILSAVTAPLLIGLLVRRR